MAAQDNNLTLLVVGDGGVGKSALTIQFIENRFVTDYNPTIEDSFVKRCQIDSVMYAITILDTAGQEEFSALREQHFPKANGFVLIYSVTDRRSFESIRVHHKKILSYLGVPVICGNKSDLHPLRVVQYEEGAKLAAELKLIFKETSAKECKNIDDAFFELVRRIKQHKASGGTTSAAVTDNPDYYKKKKKCIVM